MMRYAGMKNRCYFALQKFLQVLNNPSKGNKLDVLLPEANRAS